MRHPVHAKGFIRLHAQSDLLHEDANSPIKQHFTEDCRCEKYALEAWNRSLRLTQYSLKQPQLPCNTRKAASKEMLDGSCPASSSSCATKDSFVNHRVRKLSICLACYSGVKSLTPDYFREMLG